MQKTEPTSHGADLMAGSLIKNPGGGIAPTGGYIAGRKDLVESCSYRLTTPGTGREIGATLGNNRELFMGAFHAPHVTGEALNRNLYGRFVSAFWLCGHAASRGGQSGYYPSGDAWKQEAWWRFVRGFKRARQ